MVHDRPFDLGLHFTQIQLYLFLGSKEFVCGAKGSMTSRGFLHVAPTSKRFNLLIFWKKVEAGTKSIREKK